MTKVHVSKAWTERDYKCQYRRFAVKSRKPAKVYLTLPSDSIADIDEGMDAKTIDQNTFILAVEKDRAKAATIARKLKRLKLRHYVHHGQLHRLPLSVVLHDHGFHRVDLAFIDLCGHMTCQTARWIMDLDPRTFAPGTKVSWTFNTVVRNNLLMQWLHRDNDGNYVDKSLWHQRRLVDSAIDKCHQTSYRSRTGETDGTWFSLYALYGAMSKNWMFSFDRIHEYKDSSPMVYIETTIRRPAKVENGVTKNLQLSIDTAECCKL